MCGTIGNGPLQVCYTSKWGLHVVECGLVGPHGLRWTWSMIYTPNSMWPLFDVHQLSCINCPSKVVWVSNAAILVKRRFLVVIQVAMMMLSCAISFWWMSCTYCLGANVRVVSKCTFMEKLIVHTMLSTFNRPIGLDPINLFSDPC